MQVSNLGVNSSSVPSQSQTDATQAASGDAESNIPTAANSYRPSPEWQQLINQVRQQPDVRSERVQEVAARLQQGYYQSRASVEDTAAAILKSQD
jgi:hypothetical protein